MKLRRLVLLLCVLGMISMLHLWVQKQHHFDHGCWGIGGAVAAVSGMAGCQNPTLEKRDALFNVPLTAWGYGLYFFVGATAFAGILASGRTAQWLHVASEAALAAALPYSFYLVYYQIAAHAYCPLCLVSDGLIMLLFVVHLIQHWRGFEVVAEANRGLEMGFASGVLFGGTALMFGLLLFVDQVGTRRLDQGDYTEQFETMMGRSLPKFIDVARLQEMKPALFDDRVPRIASAQWITPHIPVLGNANGVKVLAFLDPNCPHCGGTFAMLKRLGDRFGPKVGIYILPRVLWDFSMLQSLGLEAAGAEGKYLDMWQLQFDRQKQGGLSMDEIKALFNELNIDATDLKERLERLRPEVATLRSRAAAAGINQTPTIFINGRAVAPNSMDERSIAKLIESAGSQELNSNKAKPQESGKSR